MTLQDLRQQVLFQTGNDLDDLGDFQPHLTDYLNDGYDRLCVALCGEHVSEDSAEHPPLVMERDEPALPAWAHGAVGDWATWLIYRNGSATRQSRGYAFRASFEAAEKKLRGMTAEEKGLKSTGAHFGNIPL